MADVKVLSKQEIFGCYIQAAWGTAAADAATFYTLQWVNAGVLNPDPGVTVDQFNVTSQNGIHSEIERVYVDSTSGLKTVPFGGTASILNMAPFLYSSHFVCTEATSTPYNKVITAGGLTAPIDFANNGTKFFTWACKQGGSADDNWVLVDAIVDTLNIVWDFNNQGIGRLVSYSGTLKGRTFDQEQTLSGDWTNDTAPTTQDFFGNTDTWAFITLDVDSVDLKSECIRRVEYSVNNNVSGSCAGVGGKIGQYDIAPEYMMKVVLNYNSVTEKCLKDFADKAAVDANWSNDSASAKTDGKWTIDIPTGHLISPPKIYEGDFLGVELNIKAYSTAAATPVTINYCDTVDWTL